MIRVRRLNNAAPVPMTGEEFPRQLAITELGASLSDGQMSVDETFLSFKRFPLREWDIWRVAAQSSDVDVLLVDQIAGIRLAFLRMLGLETPKICMISYDPFPSNLNPGPQSPVDWNERIRRMLFRRLDCIFVVSKDQARWLRPRIGGSTAIIPLPMAIDLDMFCRRDASDGEYIMLVDGALRDYDTLSQAILHMNPQPPKLIVAHRLPLSEEKKLHLSRVEANGVDVRTISRASGKLLNQLYERSQVVVVPVKKSSQPVGLTALLEAMAVGCPIIATSGAWLEEYASPGREALMVPPSDPASLAEAMSQIYIDQDLRRELGQQAMIRGRLFTFDRPREIVRKTLKSVAMQHRRSHQRSPVGGPDTGDQT